MKEGLSAADVRLSQRLSHVAEHNTSIRRAAIVLAHSGDSHLWVGGLLLTLWLGSAPWQVVAKVDLVGIGIAAVVVQVMKLLVRRPSTGRGSENSTRLSIGPRCPRHTAGRRVTVPRPTVVDRVTVGLGAARRVVSRRAARALPF
jgi:hypothetical protein